MNEQLRQFCLSVFAGCGLLGTGALLVSYVGPMIWTLRALPLWIFVGWIVGAFNRQMIHTARKEGYQAGDKEGYVKGYARAGRDAR